MSNETFYVRFTDGVSWIAPLGSYSILPQYTFDLTDHKPLSSMMKGIFK